MSIEHDPVAVGGAGAGLGALLFALARRVWNGKSGVAEEVCKAHRDSLGRSIDDLREDYRRLEKKVDDLPDKIVSRLKE